MLLQVSIHVGKFLADSLDFIEVFLLDGFSPKEMKDVPKIVLKGDWIFYRCCGKDIKQVKVVNTCELGDPEVLKYEV